MIRHLRPGARTAVTAAVLLGLAPVTAGCAAGFDAATNRPYTPADGVNTQVGDIAVRGATLVGEEAGGPATLVVALVNEGNAADALVGARVKGGGDATIPGGRLALPSGTLVQVGTGEGPSVTLSGPARTLAPGSFIPLELSFDNAGTTTVRVLVHAPQGQYATITPAPEPTPTAPPGGSATEQPGAGATPSTAATQESGPTPTSTATGSPAP